MCRETLLIIDFGSQYTHLIARRVRQLGVYSAIYPYNSNDFPIDCVKGVILSGGPMSVLDEKSPMIDRATLMRFVEREIPILGICYGHQLLAKLLGGKVLRGPGEYGRRPLTITFHGRLFDGVPRKIFVWMNHSDSVFEVPNGFRVTATTDYCPVAGFEFEEKKIFGVQFHPEVSHTEYGVKILNNFLDICLFSRDWQPKNFVKDAVENIRGLVGDGEVMVATSGGVDSITTAMLIKRALGADRVHIVFIDTGFLRYGEREYVLGVLDDLGFKNVHLVEAEDLFYGELLGVSDPDDKRTIFSRLYASVLNDAARRLIKTYPKLKFLAQGTIYPDRIESAFTGTNPSRIKKHHNVTMPSIKKLRIIEPLADLYKDEVREIAKILGVPEKIVYRQPFPGPGLLIRVAGKVTKEKIEICRVAHKIVEDEAEKWGLTKTLWQIFPVVLDTKTTGIKGDRGVYQYAVAIRAVISSDGMTADYAKLPWEFLDSVSNRLTGEIENVCRVLYDITTKPPATIEFE